MKTESCLTDRRQYGLRHNKWAVNRRSSLKTSQDNRFRERGWLSAPWNSNDEL
jgi:hypothetical protein